MMGEAARHSRSDDSAIVPQPAITILSAESLRGSGSAYTTANERKGDDRVSLFWRVFGGTLLSLAGLIGITVYQQFNAGLNELRTELNRLNESRADFVKKDELTARTSNLWTGIKDLQAAASAVSVVREHEALLEQRMKAAEEERKEMTKEIQQLRERLAALEGKHSSPKAGAAKGDGD